MSNIDPTVPTHGQATTQSVRDNFQIAADEISALQAAASTGPFLPLDGGQMSGPLLLDAPPAADLEASTKGYVDLALADADTAAASTYLPFSGGVLRGPLLLDADPLDALGASTKQYVDNRPPLGGPYLATAGGAMTGVLLLAADPAADLQAATKRYVDARGPFLSTGGGAMTGPLLLAADPADPLGASTRQYVDNHPPLGGPYLALAGGGPITGPILTPQATPLTLLNGAAPSAPAGAGVLFRLISSIGGNTRAVLETYGNSQPAWLGKSAGGTPTAPLAVPPDQVLVTLAGWGWGSTAFVNSADVILRAAETFSDTSAGSYIQFHTTKVGTTAVTERARITDAGSLLLGLTVPLGTNHLQVVGGGTIDTLSTSGLGMFGVAPVTVRPNVTGSRGANAALASLITTLAAYGLLTDGTTA